MQSNLPFEIKLTAEGGPGLRAVLVNRSPAAQTFFHDPLLQPSRLELVDPAGKTVDAFDSRSVKKYDSTIRCSALRTLSPGAEVELGSVRFKRAGGGFATVWGPFEFEGLSPGAYTARVIWESAAASCFDEGTQQSRQVPGIWLGKVSSSDVTVRLP